VSKQSDLRDSSASDSERVYCAEINNRASDPQICDFPAKMRDLGLRNHDFTLGTRDF